MESDSRRGMRAGCAHLPTAPESQNRPATSSAAAVRAPTAVAPPFRRGDEQPFDRSTVCESTVPKKPARRIALP